MIDLFGIEIPDEPRPGFPGNASKGKRDYTPKGYAAPPGTGPKGEACKTCKFFVRREFSKTYFKCLLAAKRIPKPLDANRGPGHYPYVLDWSHCHTSDIRANSPACSKWAMPDPIEWVRERRVL